MKNKLLKIVNPVLFVVALIQVVTGIGQQYVGQDLFLLFRRIHNIFAYVLVIVIIIHLYLNWGWIKINLFKSRRKK